MAQFINGFWFPCEASENHLMEPHDTQAGAEKAERLAIAENNARIDAQIDAEIAIGATPEQLKAFWDTVKAEEIALAKMGFPTMDEIIRASYADEIEPFADETVIYKSLLNEWQAKPESQRVGEMIAFYANESGTTNEQSFFDRFEN